MGKKRGNRTERQNEGEEQKEWDRLNGKWRERDEQRQHRNTSNEDEQQRESVTEEERWLIDRSDKGEDECLTLTTVIIWPACNSLPILATK